MSHKMDPKLVSKQKHELDYFKRKYNVGAKIIRQVIEEVGHSRKKILEKLTEMGLINE